MQHVNSNRSRDVGALANTLKLVLLELLKLSYDQLNEGLHRVDFAIADPYHLIAMLRALSDPCENLKNWPWALQQSRDHLVCTGMEDSQVNSLMQGLDIGSTSLTCQRSTV